MLQRLMAALLLPGWLLVAAPAAAAAGDDPVVAEISGNAVTRSTFLAWLRELNPQIDFAALPTAEQRRLLERFASGHHAAQRAVAQGLDRDPEIAARLAFFRQQVLSQAWRDARAAAVVVSEDEVQAAWRSNKALYTTPDRFDIEHLVYRTPDAAVGARNALRAGTPWAELAQARGGDQAALFSERNLFAADILLPELRGPVAALQPGEVSDLVHSNYGYHVVRLVEVDRGGVQPLAEVRAAIIGQLRTRKALAALEQTRQQAINSGELVLYPQRAAGG